MEFASQSMTYPPGRVISHSLHMRFSKLLHFLPENLQHTQWRMNMLRLSAVNFTGKVCQSHITMEPCTKELVSNASAQLFSDNTLSSFRKFYQSNWIWKANGRLRFQKYPNHQCTKMSRREDLCFLDKKLSNLWHFYYLEPGLYSVITYIVRAMNSLIQERHKHSEHCITFKVSRRTQKVETHLAI